jgi:WD40 repeat protein
MSGHFAPNKVTNEVWGLTLYDDKYYATCSDDGTVRIWDLKTK